jgi:hypothetical protein
MINSKLELPVVDTVCERDADSVVSRLEVADFVEREPHHGGGLNIELPALREKRIVRAIA